MNRLLEIVDELAYVLEEGADLPVLRYRMEEDPLHLEFLYHPPQEEAPAFITAPEEQSEVKEVIGQKEEQLPVNYNCTFCSGRMYAVKKYFRKGNKPLLVIYHNGPFGATKLSRDTSDRFIFGSPECDDIFFRLVQKLGLQNDDPYYQEFLACHFSSDRSLPEEWNDRTRNCLHHLEDTIRKHSIKLIIAAGSPGVFLAGEELFKKQTTTPGILPFTTTYGQEVPLLLMRSPSALIAIEKKRKKFEQSSDRTRYEEVKAEEVQIKKGMLAVFEKALSSL